MEQTYYHICESYEGFSPDGRTRKMTPKSAKQANIDLMNVTDGGLWIDEERYNLNFPAGIYIVADLK
jgi:hypothetical protein